MYIHGSVPINYCPYSFVGNGTYFVAFVGDCFQFPDYITQCICMLFMKIDLIILNL